jgi:hypothetical protein
MPKLQNVTVEQLTTNGETAENFAGELWGLRERILKGYCEDVPKPHELANGFLALCRSAGDLAATLLHKAAMAEQQRELEALLQERQDKLRDARSQQ